MWPGSTFPTGISAPTSAVMDNLRQAASGGGTPVGHPGGPPGPKMRLGQISPEPVELIPGASFSLTTEEIVGDAGRASVTFAHLPQAVKPGNTLLLSDGLLQLEVIDVQGQAVNCRVIVGGELRSRKGLNLPGIRPGRQRLHGTRPQVPGIRLGARGGRGQPVFCGIR